MTLIELDVLIPRYDTQFMSKREKIREEITALYNESAKLTKDFQDKKVKQFHYEYQHWYTQALRVVTSLAPNRLEEFRGYYEIDPKRKSLTYGTYVIQDFLKGVVPAGYQYQNFDSEKQALICFYNQITIFKAILDNINSVLSDIRGELYSELEDNEIIAARQLIKINLRAAGSLIGVVIEGHLQKIATAHNVSITKKNPTIADLNDPLKNASVIDIPTWRKISFLADIRNLCSHKKDAEPNKEQVEELIQGAEWVTKNIF